MKLAFYHTPELCPAGPAPDCAVVIDVLRATSTIATALAAGAEAVQVFSEMAALMQASEGWPEEKRLRAGERGGQRVEGCDLGNSPLDCTPERVGGRRLFMSTTNGTRALERVRAAPVVLAAALINRRRVVHYLLAHRPAAVWLVGSGWEGNFSLEDTVCAGAIAQGLLAETAAPLAELAQNDELIAALALYEQWRDRLLELLHLASHGRRLLRLGGLERDLEFCSRIDSLEALPIQQAPGVLVNCLE